MKEVGLLITVTSPLAMKSTLAMVTIIVTNSNNNNSRVTGQVSPAFLNPVKSEVFVLNY